MILREPVILNNGGVWVFLNLFLFFRYFLSRLSGIYSSTFCGFCVIYLLGSDNAVYKLKN